MQKYKLPPSHELWAGQPFASHFQEFLEDKVADREELSERLRDPNTDPMSRLRITEVVTAIDKILEDENVSGRSGDLIMDAFEIAEERGDEFDMDMSAEEARQYLASVEVR